MGAAIVAACAVATVVTCGGFAAAATAVCMVGSGIAATTTASTIAAGAFIGSAMVYGFAALTAASTSNSIQEFNAQGNWGTVAATAGGALWGGYNGYNSQPTGTQGQGFNTFGQLKGYLGSPGTGNQWHHIVEQSQIGKSGFSPQMIHNTNNIVAINSNTHAAISGYYSSIQPFTNGMLVRNWLAGQSFEAQYAFGIDVINLFTK